MRNYLTLVLFLCTIFSSTAQLSTYDISTYARPDLERKTLRINPSFLSNGFFFNQDYYDNFILPSQVDENWFSINLGMSLYHTRFVNTAETQTNVINSAGISGAYHPSWFVISSFADAFAPSPFYYSINSQDINFRFDASYNRNYSRKKFRAEQRFWEIDYDIRLFYRYYTYSEDDIDDYSITNSDSSIRINIYHGKGRIELINDAWHAQTILEMLQEQGSLETEPSHELITQMANRISEIKNIRNTDFRLESISEYEALVKFFMENDLVDKEDYRFFAVLNDAWRYESFINRLSGTEFKYGIGIRSDLYHYNDKDESPTDLTLLRFELPRLSVQYNRYKPLSTDFQFNNLNSINFALFGEESISNESLINYRVFTTYLSSIWEYQYLPNQRTFYSLGVELRSDYFNFLNSELDRADFWASKLRLRFAYRRYVSPRLSFSLNANLEIYNRQLDREYWGMTHGVNFQTSYRLY